MWLSIRAFFRLLGPLTKERQALSIASEAHAASAERLRRASESMSSGARQRKLEAQLKQQKVAAQ